VAEVDLDRLFSSRLAPRLSTLEARRRGLRNTIIGGILVAALGVSSCVAVFNPGSLQQQPWWRFGPLLFGAFSLLCFWIGISRFLMPGIAGQIGYRAQFKKEIVTEVVKAFLPGARHFADRSIPKDVFDQSRLFDTDGKLEGDDLIQGSIGDTPFEACELGISRVEGDGDDRKTVAIFHGMFIRIDMDRDVPGRTLVQPSGEGSGDRDGMEAVSFDAAFDDVFTVWSTDPAAARALLEPALRSRLLALTEDLSELHLSFAGPLAIAALPMGGKLFEPSIGSAFDVKALRQMVWPLEPIPGLVRALGLEQRRRPADPDFHGARVVVSRVEAATASGGELGFHELMDAIDQTPAGADEARPLAPPLATYSTLEDAGSEMSVSYPVGLGLLIATLFALALTPITAALGLNLVAPGLAKQLAAERLPALGELLAFAENAPVVIFLVTAFLWWMFAGTLLTRPKRVTVSPEGVVIGRVLPLRTLRLPLELIRNVQQQNRILSFIRSDRSFIRSFVTASPAVGSDNEADWLVQELRRGMKRAGWRPPAAARKP